MVKSRAGCDRGIHILAAAVAAAEDMHSFFGLDRISPVVEGKEERSAVVDVDVDIPAAACWEDSRSRVHGHDCIYSPGRGSSRRVVNQEEEEDEIRSGAGIRVCVWIMTPLIAT